MGGFLSKERGRGRSSTRGELTENFIRQLAEDFRLFGPEVIQKLREEQPGKYVEAISRLVPAEMLLTQDEHADLAEMNFEQLKEFFLKEAQALFNVRLIEGPQPVKERSKAPA
jgi:hypothetical protein